MLISTKIKVKLGKSGHLKVDYGLLTIVMDALIQ